MPRLKLFNRLAKFRGKLTGVKVKTDSEENLNDSDLDSNFSSSSEARRLLATSDSDSLNDKFIDDFLCTCCFEVLLNPISLLCGHNFCLICLANWFLISNKCVCPTCRQEWIGAPKVNLVLK